MSKIYTGIGSRTVPQHIFDLMQKLGYKLAAKRAVLRSGAARGSDSAFEYGCDKYGRGAKEIYKAHSYYVSDYRNNRLRSNTDKYDIEYLHKAMAIAISLHPAWNKLSEYPKRLMIRNCFQVLGLDLCTPADFVICWTPDGAKSANQTSQKTGGTGQAIRLASKHGIKIYNLATQEDYDLAKNWIN